MGLEGQRAMRIRLFGFAAAFSGLLLAGCSRRESPAPQAPASPPASTASVKSATEATATSPATTAETMPATAAPAPATTAAVPSPVPKAVARMPASPKASSAPAPQPAASEPGPAPAAPAAPPPPSAPSGGSASKVDDPGGAVSVASTNPGATRIGPEKCKICHKLQHASWAETAHARRIPPLECESCHGPGSEYKTLTTMKDPAKAKAAGLVIPDASFCATCHKRDWKSDMLSKAHAHKAKTAS